MNLSSTTASKEEFESNGGNLSANPGLWLCTRCRGTDYAKDTTGLTRCVSCAMPRKYAICAYCGNGAQAHTPHGCEGVSDDGNPCECQQVGPT